MWFSRDFIHRVIECCYILIDLITPNFDKYRTYSYSSLQLSDYENLSLKKYGEIVPTKIYLNDGIKSLYFQKTNYSKKERESKIYFTSSKYNSVNNIISDKNKISIPNLNRLNLYLSNHKTLDLINFESSKIETLSLGGINLKEDIKLPKSLKKIDINSRNLGFLYNNDLTDISLSIFDPTEDFINNMPNNITNITILKLRYPLTNLPISLKYIQINLNPYGINMNILPKCKFPYDCEVVFMTYDRDNNKKILEELNLSYSYKLIYK
jgi:hypothetical protein